MGYFVEWIVGWLFSGYGRFIGFVFNWWIVVVVVMFGKFGVCKRVWVVGSDGLFLLLFWVDCFYCGGVGFGVGNYWCGFGEFGDYYWYCRSIGGVFVIKYFWRCGVSVGFWYLYWIGWIWVLGLIVDWWGVVGIGYERVSYCCCVGVLFENNVWFGYIWKVVVVGWVI